MEFKPQYVYLDPKHASFFDRAKAIAVTSSSSPNTATIVAMSSPSPAAATALPADAPPATVITPGYKWAFIIVGGLTVLAFLSVIVIGLSVSDTPLHHEVIDWCKHIAGLGLAAFIGLIGGKAS
jgi:hypothetical protein